MICNLRLTRNARVLVVAVLATLGSPSALSDRRPLDNPRDPLSCATLLQPDTEIFQRDSMTHIAYLESISKSQYDKAESAGTLSVLLPVFDLPIDIGGGWKNFRGSLSAYEQSINYQLDQTDSIRYYSSRISPKAADAFVACMRIQKDGLFVYAHNSVDGPTGNVLLAIEWRPAAGIQSKIAVALDPGSNGRIDPKYNSVTVGENGYQLVPVMRTDRSLSLTVIANGSLGRSGGDYADSFTDPGVPKVTPPPPLTFRPWNSDYDSINGPPYEVCTVPAFPKDFFAKVSVAGDWRGPGRNDVGPCDRVMGWQTWVIVRDARTKSELSHERYEHFNVVTGSVDYKICFKLTDQSSLAIQDTLRIAIYQATQDDYINRTKNYQCLIP